MDTFRRPDKPHLPGYVGVQGAGEMLTWLGFITLGSTCPFAVVLCVEWLRDPRRTDEHRQWDKAALVFAVPGACIWLWFSVAFIPYSAVLVLYFWPLFAVWLLVRVFTRWRQISELRRLDAQVPAVGPPDSADGETTNETHT